MGEKTRKAIDNENTWEKLLPFKESVATQRGKDMWGRMSAVVGMLKIEVLLG